ncbi:MAG TPA: hemolysin family protein [Promineifilum sp.]
MNLIIGLVTVSLMILLTGLYVAAEFSTVAARKSKISWLAGQNDPLARMLLPVLEDGRKLDQYVAACQVGITISSLILGAYAQGAIATRIHEPLAQLLGAALSPTAAFRLAQTLSVLGVLFLITALQDVLGELFPKSLAIQFPEGMAKALVWPMRISLVLFALPIWIFNGSSNVLLRLLGRGSVHMSGRAHSPQEIELLVTESHEGGLLDDNERRLLRNALRLRDLTARQVMVHRTRMAAAPLDTSPLDLMQLAIDEGFSRIPLYRETIDEIVGFVHVKDVFRIYSQGAADVSGIIRDVVYVPETLPITDAWEQLNLRNRYLAVVFDEFGGTAGLLTLEDLIEEIFGELQDEFDDEVTVIARDKEGRIYLRGDLLVSDVNESLELDLPTDAADTLSGLMFNLLGRPPVKEDEVKVAQVVIRVEEMEDLGVGRLSLLMPPGDKESHFSEWDIADHE